MQFNKQILKITFGIFALFFGIAGVYIWQFAGNGIADFFRKPANKPEPVLQKPVYEKAPLSVDYVEP